MKAGNGASPADKWSYSDGAQMAETDFLLALKIRTGAALLNITAASNWSIRHIGDVPYCVKRL